MSDKRLRLSSRPRTARTSNTGGDTVRPVSAARNTVVVAGGGFTGIETATEMPARLRSVLGYDHDIRVIVVDRAPQIYIYGEVQRPGAMRLERDMTVLQGLASGGGLTQRGTEKGIRVHRKGADGRVQIITPGMDDRMQDGDVVYVRESLF